MAPSSSRRFPMDGKEISRYLTTTISSFLQDLLLDGDRRRFHREQCAERLAAATSSSDVRYSDQTILANLGWGIEALEDAITTSSSEAKLARLDHAERMLQVCAMLDPSESTSVVPNSYLSAWAHLHLASLNRLRDSTHGASTHMLEMFDLNPTFSRVDIAPELWSLLFLPHMTSVAGWYSEARHKVLLDSIADVTDMSFAAEFDDQMLDQSLIASVRPDQAEKLRELEWIYGESLDYNTRMYAKYYKDLLNYSEKDATKKSMLALPPIAEPPLTPLHEVSRSISDLIKFGPILSKSAGFLPVLKGEKEMVDPLSCHNRRNDNRCNSTPNYVERMKETVGKSLQLEVMVEEDDDKIQSNGGVRHKIKDKLLIYQNSAAKVDTIGNTEIQSSRRNYQFMPFYQVKCSNMSSPSISPSRASAISIKHSPQLLRLSSKRFQSPSTNILSPVESSLNSSPDISSSKQVNETEFNLHKQSRRSRLMYQDDESGSSASSDDELDAPLNCMKKYDSTWRLSSESRKYGLSNSGPNSENEDEVHEAKEKSILIHSSEMFTSERRPPKDFVCPITGQIFSDPVTLETGQTYERKAIQEWLERGNTTCPITRQPLSSTILPKTNYILKKLITSWIEQNHDLAEEFSCSDTPKTLRSTVSTGGLPIDSPTKDSLSLSLIQGKVNALNSNMIRRFVTAEASDSPTSVISQATRETLLNTLKNYTSSLCTSEDLKECETTVLTIAKIWKDSRGDPGVHHILSKSSVLNGFMDVISTSADIDALKASVYILSEVVSTDKNVGDILARIDSELGCLTKMLVNGFDEVIALLYLLGPSSCQISSNKLVPILLEVITGKSKSSGEFQMAIEPRDAGILWLDQILSAGDEDGKLLNASTVMLKKYLPAIIKLLDQTEERLAIVSLLLSCMRADPSCRYIIANTVELVAVLEMFHSGSDNIRRTCIDFLAELVCLNRRALRNQILKIIRDEGVFSTMHSLLVYLQMAPMEQQPKVAGLLLQLDLLVEPRKTSIFREEAIDALIESMQRKDFPVCQIAALDILSTLSGRLGASGKPITASWLLKLAGISQPYNLQGKEEKCNMADDLIIETTEEEANAASAWEKRVALVLCNHENGAIFKALEECFKSNSLELEKSCLVVATWLIYMLDSLPDTGVKSIAGQCLIDRFVQVLNSSVNVEEKVLITLALRSFILNPDATEVHMHLKHIYKLLRKLRRCSGLVTDTLKVITSMPSIDVADFWSCTEIFEVDCISNGKVLSLVYSQGRLFSSHHDGSIKVWDAQKKAFKLTQNLLGHLKPVTCINIPTPGDKLYSGSYDKTIRIWTIQTEGIHSNWVHDMKEPIRCLSVHNDVMYYASQGTGLKVYNGKTVPKTISFNKTVKCVALAEGYLYSACSGCSIQEVDLSKCTTNALFPGTRKLLGKQKIYALCIHDGILFSGGSSVDGIAGKAFSLSSRTVIGSFATGLDIHSMTVNSDFIFTGTKCGIIEVWSRERFTRVASIRLDRGGNTKITSMAVDSEDELLFASTSDGKIRVWALD